MFLLWLISDYKYKGCRGCSTRNAAVEIVEVSPCPGIPGLPGDHYRHSPSRGDIYGILGTIECTITATNTVFRIFNNRLFFFFVHSYHIGRTVIHTYPASVAQIIIDPLNCHFSYLSKFECIAVLSKRLSTCFNKIAVIPRDASRDKFLHRAGTGRATISLEQVLSIVSYYHPTLSGLPMQARQDQLFLDSPLYSACTCSQS
jgi:hypothetical protein